MAFWLAIVFISVFGGAFADQQFNCPNSGQPKLDEATGKPLQCLPGQAASEIVCGKGYSCYFSGFNYQCCPTAEEEEEVGMGHHHDSHGLSDHSHDDAAECPHGSFTVLSSGGSPIKCNPRTRQCPQPGMFCSSDALSPSNTAVCCEKMDQTQKPVKKSSPEKVHKKVYGSAQRLLFSDKITTIVNRDIHEECPTNALMVLSDEGKPVTCSENSKCPQDNMFCHSSISSADSYCCQEMDSGKEGSDANAQGGSNPLKFNPDEAKKLVEELKEQEMELEKAMQKTDDTDVTAGQATGQPPAATPSDNPTEASTSAGTEAPPAQHSSSAGSQSKDDGVEKEIKYADNEVPSKKKLVDDGESAKAKAQAVRTRVEANLDGGDASADPAIEYKPHGQGGYAVSRKLDKINSRKPADDQRLLAQQYLLEQIKNGWPYEEKFYRGESVAVLRRGTHPSAIIHFPNRA